MSDRKEENKRRTRINNALRAIKIKEAKTLPIHMIKRDTHELLTINIRNNNILNNLLKSIDFDSKYNNLLKLINNIFSETVVKYNYCIGGSKAWNNIFKDFYDNNLLSEYEKSAIHNNNTIDHYYFVNYNDSGYIDNVKNEIEYILNDFIRNINEELNNNIKALLKDDNKEVHLSVIIDDCNKYKRILFKESALIALTITITDIVPKMIQDDVLIPQRVTTSKRCVKRKTAAEEAKEAEIEKKHQEQLKQLQKDNRAARAALLAEKRAAASQKKGGANNDVKIIKTILSFEINFRDINDEYLVYNIDQLTLPGSKYLNVYGLYLFNQFAKIKIFLKRDRYNVFKIRELIYNKLILINEYKCDTTFKILDIYTKLFKDFNIPNQYLYNELQKLALTSNPDIELYINDMEMKIIECLRPYINQTIYAINNDIKELQFFHTFQKNSVPNIKGEDYSGIFIVGGDAIRRYDIDASVTKDIDSKIYMPAEIDIDTNIKNYNTINKCISSNLFKLASFLICNKEAIFAPITVDIIKEFEASEYYRYNCKTSFKLNSEDPNFLNFRFRQLPKSKFPVDLYSLDYRCVIDFEFSFASSPEIIYKYSHNYDIAFIDVVLEISQDNNYDKYAVLSNNLPISSLEFLIHDLIKTYNNDTSSLMRFISGKSGKDYVRFKVLTEMVKSKEIFELNNKNISYKKTKNRTNNLVLDNKITFDTTTSTCKRYIDLFNKIYHNDNDKKVEKKIIYDYELSILKEKEAKVGGSKSQSSKSYHRHNSNNYIDYSYYEKMFNIKSSNITEIPTIDTIIQEVDNDISIIMTPAKELPTDVEEKILIDEIMKKNKF